MEPSDNNQSPPPLLKVWALAGQLGFIIAVPLVLLVLVGVQVDQYFETTPLFIFAGMVLAALTSTVSIVRKLKDLKLL